MESLVDIPLVVLAVMTLAAIFWAATTSTRVTAWSVTAGLLWLGTASFVASALLGTPLVLLALGWSLTVAAFVVGGYALFGSPRRADAALEVRHALNVR
jgi:hypothetical protein